MAGKFFDLLFSSFLDVSDNSKTKLQKLVQVVHRRHDWQQRHGQQQSPHEHGAHQNCGNG